MYMFLWRTDENYPSIIIKYPHLLQEAMGPWLPLESPAKTSMS